MVCHSERSEESSESRLAAAKWILRYAQNDNRGAEVFCRAGSPNPATAPVRSQGRSQATVQAGFGDPALQNS